MFRKILVFGILAVSFGGCGVSSKSTSLASSQVSVQVINYKDGNQSSVEKIAQLNRRILELEAQNDGNWFSNLFVDNWHIPIIEWSDKYGLGLPRNKEGLREVRGILIGWNKEEMKRESKDEFNYEINISKNFFDTENSKMAYIPKEIGKLESLEFLWIDGNIVEIPKEIGELESLEFLGFRNTKLTELPKEIGNLESLEIFVIFNNDKLKKTVPQSFANLKNLKILLTDTKFTKFPHFISSLKNLQCLEKIRFQEKPTSLPKSINNLKNLQYYGNYCKQHRKFNETPHEFLTRVLNIKEK